MKKNHAKRYLAWLCALAVMFAATQIGWLVSLANTSHSIWSGNETAPIWVGQPDVSCYVNTAEELAYIVAHSASYNIYKLTSDIYLNDLSEFDTWAKKGPVNSWRGGSAQTHITIDGDGHMIYGLYQRNANKKVGLFTEAAGNGFTVTFKNIGIDYAYLNGKMAAAFCAEAQNADSGTFPTFVFENCYIGEHVTIIGDDGKPTKNGRAGGFVANGSPTLTLKNCASLAKVQAENGGAGGFMGGGYWGTVQEINNCYTTNPILFGGSTYPGLYTDCTNDPDTVYAPSEAAGNYYTFCPVANMKGVTAQSAMSGLGSAWVTTTEYPIQRIFLSEIDETVNLPFAGESGTPVSTPHTALTKISQIAFAGENALSYNRTATAVFYKDKQPTSESSEVYEQMFNSAIDHDQALGASHDASSTCYTKGLANDLTQTDHYWQLQLELNGTLNHPDQFVFVAHASSQAVTSRHYAVFVSDSEETLYDKNSKIIEIYDSTDRLGDKVDLAALGIVRDKITFVGIRFYHRGYVNDAGCNMQHIYEIGLYGGEFIEDLPSTPHTLLKSKDQISFIGENLWSNYSSATANFYANDVVTYEYSAVRPEMFNSAIDRDQALGSWHTASSSCKSSNTLNDLSQTSNYWQLELELGGVINNPTQFMFVAHATSATVMSKHYAVFASSKKADIYDDKNKIIEITDQNDRLGDRVNLETLGVELANIRYIAVRFYHRGYVNSAGCNMQHIYEIGFYGGEFVKDKRQIRLYKTLNQYSDGSLANDIEKIGKNLIAGQNPYLARVNGAKVTVGNWRSVTDGVLTKHLDIGAYYGQNDGTFDMIYRLDEDPNAIKEVKKFIHRGSSIDAEWSYKYYTGKYEVYAGISPTELIQEQNLIYAYDYEKDGTCPCQTVTFTEPIYARYVAVRIINPVTTCTDTSYFYPRISEIAFLGNDADIPNEQINLAPHMPVDAYLISNGERTQLTDSFTAEMSNALTDEDPKTIVDFKADGKTLDLIYNLCQDFTVTKIWLDTEKTYAVYASETFPELWSDTAKVSDGAFDGKILSARYIRFSFAEGQGNTVTLSDAHIIGLANPLISRYEHLSYSLDFNNLVVFEKQKDQSVNYLSSAYNNLFDTDYYGENLVAGGVKGESTLNVLVRLANLQNVSRISLYFPRHLVRYHPTELHLYVAETYEDAMNFSKKPLAVYKGLPADGKFEMIMRPVLARYIRIEVVKNNYGEGNEDEDYFHEKNMHIAFSEVDIEGTNVIGMGDENGTLLRFEDPQSGAVWDILSLDESDVIGQVYSSKLTETKVNDAQKTSLYSDPYYKVVGDRAYGIEFYDFFGNKINDLKGRKIKFYVPITEKQGNFNRMIGNASNAASIDLCDISENEISGKNYISVAVKYHPDLKLSVVEATTETDPYWNGVQKNQIKESEKTPGYSQTESDISNAGYGFVDSGEYGNMSEGPVRRLVDAGTTSKYSVSQTMAPVWMFILAGLQGLLFLGAIAVILILQFKKPKK